MSQKKVDAYKEQKANRKKIMKKEKAMLKLEKLIVLVVCVGAVAWVGYSVYDKTTDSTPAQTEQIVTEINTTALDNYYAGLDEADAE